MNSHFKGMKAGHCTNLKEQANEMHTDHRGRRLRTAGFFKESSVSLLLFDLVVFVCVRKEINRK